MLARLRAVSLFRVIVLNLPLWIDNLVFRGPERGLNLVSKGIEWIIFDLFLLLPSIFGCHFILMYTFSDDVIVLPECVLIFLIYRCLEPQFCTRSNRVLP